MHSIVLLCACVLLLFLTYYCWPWSFPASFWPCVWMNINITVCLLSMNNYLHRLFLKGGVSICAMLTLNKMYVWSTFQPRDFVLIPMYPKRERERDKDSAKSHLRFNINYQDYTHFVQGLRWWLVWLLKNLWVNPCTYIDPLGVKKFWFFFSMNTITIIYSIYPRR